MMPAVYMLKAKTLWYVTFVVFFICIGCCCFQMCICQQMDQLLIKICQSTPSDGCGCFGTWTKFTVHYLGVLGNH